MAGEILAMVFNTIHNLRYYLSLMERIRTPSGGASRISGGLSGTGSETTIPARSPRDAWMKT